MTALQPARPEAATHRGVEEGADVFVETVRLQIFLSVIAKILIRMNMVIMMKMVMIMNMVMTMIMMMILW